MRYWYKIYFVWPLLTFFPHLVLEQMLTPSAGKIYPSRDRVTNWVRSDNGLPPQAVINDLTCSDGIFLAGTERHDLFVSANQLANWQSSCNGSPSM
ncbi:hypothetical protein [Xanthocytophaga agilis]|uniref:Uncharacterized protein n=1 Tax=Xanthocytophaga agilis TaxID=3048010 RepID=A0AAE3QYS7_9BACT|nr:hypothetical protein [Xanthocytophaga agilis]MDJ1499955.1 hypothetical protein [Xanthocytophaga agilis]